MQSTPTDIRAEESLADLASYVSAARDLESLTRPMLALMERVTGLESTYLTSIDEAAGQQTVLFSHCSERLDIPEGLSVPWGDTLCKRALSEETYFVNDVPERWSDSDAARQLGITSYMSQPVITADGRLYGTLCAASSLRATFSAATTNIVSLFARLIGQQIDREMMFNRLIDTNSRLLNSASIDPLTGVANRRAFIEQLDALLAASDSTVSVAFIDLDGFKEINDRYGHDTGDRFLIEISLRLLKCLRRQDIVARLGGDEFVVASPEASEETLKQRIEAETQGKISLATHCFHYDGPSVGTVESEPGEDARAVIARADQAMYEVKNKRRSPR